MDVISDACSFSGMGNSHQVSKRKEEEILGMLKGEEMKQSCGEGKNSRTCDY